MLNALLTPLQIRLPYVRQLKGSSYKGDFLYSSTYIAMWSTIEVGIGISASSLCTLRPIVQAMFPNALTETTSGPPNSALKWSQKVGRIGSSSRNNNTVVTTVTGAHGGSHPDNASQENIYLKDDHVDMMPLKNWDHGISKSVQVTTSEERNHHTSGSSESLDDSKDYNSDKLYVYERV
jgi:hypothetical protein